jgi:hypothetical protein
VGIEGDEVVTNDPASRFISDLRDEADRADFRRLAAGAIPSRSPGRLVDRVRRRAAVIGASAVVLVGGFTGLAYAANGAAPGSALYGLDRALEVVGIGNGGATERLAEAQTLADHGRQASGLEHAASVVKDDPGAETALLTAAQRLQGADANAAQEEVGALLSYLSANVGHIDGKTAAELAQAIHGPGDTPPVGEPPGPPATLPGPPVSTPAGSSTTAPASPPTSVGPPTSIPPGTTP